MRTPIFIRPLTEDEQRQIQAGLRSSDAFVLRRCQMLSASKLCGSGSENTISKSNRKAVECISYPCGSRRKAAFLNPIEPKWVHGKRAIAEPHGLLSAKQLTERICTYLGCSSEPFLSLGETAL